MNKFVPNFRSYFTNLFVKITFLASLIVLILTLLMLYTFKSAALNLLGENNEKLIGRLLDNAVQMDEAAKIYMYSLFRNPSVTELMYDDQPSVLDQLTSIRALDASYNSTPFLHSIYIYNGRSDTYYSIGKQDFIRKGEFEDRDVVSLLQQSRSAGSMSMPIPRTLPDADSGATQVRVYTYLLSEYYLNGQIKNAVVINVRADWILQSIRQGEQQDSLTGSLVLLNGQGQVIGQSAGDSEWQGSEQEPYIRQIRQSEKTSGYFLSDVNGQKSFISFSRSPSPEWTLINLTPYRHIQDKLRSIEYFTAIIGAITLLLCLLTTFLLSRNLYSPIRSLYMQTVQLKRRSSDSLSGASGSEVEFIADSLLGSLHKLERLESFRNSNLTKLKQSELRSWLFGKYPVDRNIEEQFAQHAVKLKPFEGQLAILFRIDRFDEFELRFHERDRSLLKYALLNIADETFGARYRCESIDAGSDHIVTVLNLEFTGDEPPELPQVVQAARSVRDFYSNYIGLSLSVFVSSGGESIRKLPQLYEQLTGMMANRLVLGHGCTATPGDIRSLELRAEPIDYALIDKLTEALKQTKPEEAAGCLRVIIDELRTRNPDSILYSLSYLSLSLFQTVQLIEANKRIAFDLDFSSFERLKSLETLDQIEEQTELLIRGIAARMNNEKNHKMEHVIQHAERFVEENYMNPALSATYVADTLHLSAAYLNKTFREHKLYSLSEFITEVRIARAKQLLEETSWGIEDIIERIGWENKKYFYVVFKKRTGITPAEYRLKRSIAAP
ncbi:helix-turn-helix domain-containing protein [Cohnella fermenti]|nr:helix-turn-helix domain-containing protein [Cohnella fermenti]